MMGLLTYPKTNLQVHHSWIEQKRNLGKTAERIVAKIYD